MTAQVVVIVGIRHDRSSRWIECDLEVIGQVSIRSTTYDQARLGNVGRVRNMVTRDRLAKYVARSSRKHCQGDPRTNPGDSGDLFEEFKVALTQEHIQG